MLAIQRGAILSLEQELNRLQGKRSMVVEVQLALIDGRLNDARRLVSEVLLTWPMS